VLKFKIKIAAIKKAEKRKYVDWGIGWGFFSCRFFEIFKFKKKWTLVADKIFFKIIKLDSLN